MADKQYITSMGYGLPGPLVYLPSKHPENEPGALEAFRFTSEFPRCRIIGPLETLCAPSISQPPETSSRLWRERRAQERWLLKAHPDAFMGSSVFRDFLKEDMEMPTNASDAMTHQDPLVAVGHLRNLGIKSPGAMQQVMAFPAGESGELLRIARMDDSQWQWGDAKDACVKTSAANLVQREFQVTWALDGQPITQVKFTSDGSEGGLRRCLLVQKQTSTSLLRPEYRGSVVAMSKPENLSLDQQLSFIDPNPILTIQHSQTGRRAHSDVVLLPATASLPLQLAIVDECGYWMVWNLTQTRQANSKTSLELVSCGHISDGLLAEIPRVTSHPSRKHGLLWISGGEDSRHLVVWNEEGVEMVELRTKLTMPKLGPFLTDKGKPDPIVDVHKSPSGYSHILILTKYRILWVDVFGFKPVQGLPPSKPAILLNCPHPGTKRDKSRMFVCRASEEDDSSTMALTYYPQRRQLSIFWFRFSARGAIPQWHRDTITLPGSEERCSRSSIRCIRIDQAQLAISDQPVASSPGIEHHRSGTAFFQLSILRDDLSLQHCLCAVSNDARLRVSAPDRLVETGENGGVVRERQRAGRLLSRTFVLSDDMPADGLDALVLGEGEDEAEKPQATALTRKRASRPKPVSFDFERICAALQELLMEAARGESGLPSAVFHALRTALEEGCASERLPLLTWNEIAGDLSRSGDYEASDDAGVEEAVEELFAQSGQGRIVTQLASTSPSLRVLRDYYRGLWLEPAEDNLAPETQGLRSVWIDKVAKEAFLSHYGVMYQGVPLFGAQGGKVPEERDSQGVASSSQLIKSSPIKSSQAIRPSQSIMSSPIKSSQAIRPSQSIMSSPIKSSAGPPMEDGALQRLGMLCSGLRAGSLDLSKQSKVVSLWPAERGVDPSEYLSSVARANADLSRGARERLQRMEARRKVRAERAERHKRTGTGGLAGHAMSSQGPGMGESSQIWGSVPFVAASQPIAGAFGDRKKKKKTRRKSGFR